MKTVQIKGEVRENLGKKSAAQARANGNVPCVIYGGETPVHFSAPDASFKQLIYTPDAYIAEIEVAGNKVNAILKDSQFDPVSDKLTHADFLLAPANKPVVVSIPVKTVGNAIGVEAGGGLQIILRKVQVRGSVEAIPEYIEVDVTNIDLGEAVAIKDIAAVEGFDILNAPGAVVARVQVTRNARMAANEEEEAAATTAQA
jgi:large subunit ribosomal protein L25